MEHLQGMYKSNPTAFAEWKELCMSKGYLSDIFGTFENPKEFDEEKLFAEEYVCFKKMQLNFDIAVL